MFTSVSTSTKVNYDKSTSSFNEFEFFSAPKQAKYRHCRR